MYEEGESMTNHEKLKTMTDKELAEWLCNKLICKECDGWGQCNAEDGAANGLVKWLRKEEGNDGQAQT